MNEELYGPPGNALPAGRVWLSPIMGLSGSKSPGKPV